MINFYTTHNSPEQLDHFEIYGKTLSLLDGIHAPSRFNANFDSPFTNIPDATWEPIRHILKTKIQYAYYYANEVIKQRWYDAEPHLKTNPGFAYYYAKNVIKGPWLEAEPYILTSSIYSVWYTINIKNERWLEAEPIIMENSYNWEQYCLHFNIS
jgi:hypothetical protein